jgi:hypothetical protein
MSKFTAKGITLARLPCRTAGLLSPCGGGVGSACAFQHWDPGDRAPGSAWDKGWDVDPDAFAYGIDFSVPHANELLPASSNASKTGIEGSKGMSPPTSDIRPGTIRFSSSHTVRVTSRPSAVTSPSST